MRKKLKRAVAPVDAWVVWVQSIIYPFPRSAKLAKIADWVNRNPVMGLRATTEPSHYSTDRKLAGTRLIHPGKGRDGTRICFYATRGMMRTGPVFNHNSAETYRHNFEVERWLADHVAKLPAAQRRKIAGVPSTPKEVT